MLRRKLQTALLLLLFLSLLSADKINLSKAATQKHKEQKIHPVQQYFEKQIPKQNSRILDQTVNNRLLVMLMEFQEDDDPSTTGNGKFQYDPGEYLLDLGKPPHDQEYFWWVLESVRYYYEAASLGAFNLDFEIYPQHNYTEADTMVVAYTLPHEMAYYNPPGVDTATMISRFEEYFADVFNTVNEADSTVDFSSYGHFMILHAGADSQHDINGDSPGDIPSFFIQIGDGKEVTVDGVVIDHACNVPETISQDDQYGVPNGVIAHEFGHSLGFIDLYSTLTGAPQVGWYDIMDSGGMGELVVMEIDGEVITVEGGLPTLPNAWHRILVWEDYLRANNMLLDIDELDWSEPIRIDPAEKLYEGGIVEYPYFIKVPLTEKEYLLIENRQVDPDGDSGLSFKGALAQAPNAPDDKGYRVLLYPTYPGIGTPDTPNWEYDLFLPGWQKVEGGTIYNYGGGLVIWHIDDGIIYEEGEWEDGEFYSNYDMNTVNALHTKRGVKVIEADGFDNIGNYNDSYNILGSAWDPFYRYQPMLTEDGEFVRWANQGGVIDTLLTNDDEFIHTINFNGLSNPALMSNDGDPGFMGLWDISSYYINPDYERFMTFRYGCHIYDEITVLENYDDLQAVSSPATIYGFPSVAVVADGKIEVLNQVSEDWDNFLEISFDYDLEISQPIVNYDLNDDGNEEILLVSDNLVSVINGLELTKMEFSSALSDAPMLLETGQMVYPMADGMMLDNEMLAVTDAKVAWDGEYLVAQNNDSVSYINPATGDIVEQFTITSGNDEYYPQVFRDEVTLNSECYVINDNGILWKITDTGMEEIFDTSDYNDTAPSQLLLTPLEAGGATRVVFAAGEKLFALTLAGSIVEGYPVFLEDRPVKAGSMLSSLQLKDEVILMLERDSDGIMAIDAGGKYRQEYSGVLPQGDITSHFWYDETFQNLNWFGGDTNGTLYNALMNSYEENPIISGSYRNNNDGMFTGKAGGNDGAAFEFTVLAYPNPARGESARFRINGATEKISFKLYDIAGNKVYETMQYLEDNPYQDIVLETSNLASGVYYARIKSGSKMLTTALGVIK